jgi:hypothetical protein
VSVGPDSPGWGPKGGRWRSTLEAAIEAEFEHKKNVDAQDDQYFKVDAIYVWGNNPVREYKVDMSGSDPPG